MPLNTMPVGPGGAELAHLTSLRVVRMAQIGVPTPCVTLLAEAGVSAENMRDLPWGELKNIVGKVDGMGVVQLTLLRVLHTRLQAELDRRSGRSSKTGSRSSSRAGSKSGSRSGGGKAEGVIPHAPQSVAFGGLQQQAAGVQGGAGVSQFASANAAACLAFADALAGAASTAGLGPFAVAVQQLGTSPWLMRFPPQPTGPGSAAAPIDVDLACGLRGCGKPRWVRRDGSLGEACCQAHTRLMAVARRDARGRWVRLSLAGGAGWGGPAGHAAAGCGACLACGFSRRRH